MDDQPSDVIYQQSERLSMVACLCSFGFYQQVSDVHQAKLPSDYEYTVIFFGDNTNSRLGPSKLRKFPQNYVEFYAKTKTNKKLKQSIQKAEERLSQNQQDVSMYESYRNQLFVKKKKAGTVSQSRLSSSQKGDCEHVPELIKNKTQQPSRRGRKRQVRKNQQIFEQQSESQKQISNISAKSNQKPPKFIMPDSRRRRNDLLVPNMKRSPLKISESSVIQQQPAQINRRRTLRGSKQIIESPRSQKQRCSNNYNMRSNQKSKQKILEQDPVVQKSNNQQSEQSQQQKQVEQRPVVQRKRRGRKAKIVVHIDNAKQQKQKAKNKAMKQEVCIQSENNQSQEEPKRVRTARRQRGRKINNIGRVRTTQVSKNNQSIDKKSAAQVGTLTQKQADKIKKNLTNRKQLTKILLQMSITTGNIKQILDLGTSIALQQGPLTKNIHLLLCTLKATLLHKYFPDNNKHRKKYQKMIKQKKKAVFMHSDQQEQRDQNQNGDDGQGEGDGQGQGQGEGEGEENNQDGDEDNSQDQNKDNMMIQQKLKDKRKPPIKSKQKLKRQQKTRQGKQAQHHINHMTRQSQFQASSNKQNKSENRHNSKNQQLNKANSQMDEKLDQIRMKAIQKLQKMIRKAGMNQNVKQYATKIQNSFQQTANAKGDLYRNIAYHRMRNIKTKLTQLGQAKAGSMQVRSYLQDAIERYQAESNVPLTHHHNHSHHE